MPYLLSTRGCEQLAMDGDPHRQAGFHRSVKRAPRGEQIGSLTLNHQYTGNPPRCRDRERTRLLAKSLKPERACQGNYLLADNRPVKSSAALDLLKSLRSLRFHKRPQTTRFKNLATEISRTRHFIGTIAIGRSGFDLTNRQRANTPCALRHYRSDGSTAQAGRRGAVPAPTMQRCVGAAITVESGISQRLASSISRADALQVGGGDLR